MRFRTSRSLATLAFVLAGTVTQSVFSTEIESFTEPYRTIDVAATETGLLIAAHVKEGDAVGQDQAIADLNQDVLRASLEIARIQRDATSALKSAEAELKLRTERLEKLEELRASNNASAEEVNRATLEKEVALARVLAAKETQATKRVEYERIRLQLGRRTVRSPIDGFVTKVYKDIGEFVAPTDPVVVTVVQLNPLLITFSVAVDDAANLKTKQTVALRLGKKKGSVEGLVEMISPVINAESQTVQIKVQLPNPGYKHQSGTKCYLVLSDSKGNLTERPKKNTTKK
jgi:RND family efflux transporter MFP subunit